MRHYSVAAKVVIIVLFALVGWMICGATMAIGPLLLTMRATLIVHAVVATLAFAVLSRIYFARFAFTGPLLTAAIGTVVALDAFLVAPVFGMFASPLGTWLPFALIFAATLATGLAVGRNKERPA